MLLFVCDSITIIIDILVFGFPVFNYNAGDHNVIVVDADGYDKCSASPNWGSYDSGNDVITLSSPGDNYYICQWHCDYTDQKLKVTVLQN